MGAGLPSAMMAAMVYPGRQVMAMCGDGGFMMNSQEMETAVRLKLNITVLILHDNAYGMIRWKQANGLHRLGPHLWQPRLRQICRGLRRHGCQRRERGRLAPALEAAFTAGGVHLVTVPIDYSENVRVLVDELKNRVPAEPA